MEYDLTAYSLSSLQTQGKEQSLSFEHDNVFNNCPYVFNERSGIFNNCPYVFNERGNVFAQCPHVFNKRLTFSLNVLRVAAIAPTHW
ncbi:MAG: hypothetical protein HC899_16200 [Leptolyngbyaceae cyanobacterium SM1_4_3]|nr:hypothetical protein [Leptolyngbyaceae cyanobacterium SM1_4_3]